MIAARYDEYRRRFDSITLRARPRFEGRDWRMFRHDTEERIDVYEETVAGAVADVTELLGSGAHDRATWAAARTAYEKIAQTRPDAELAATYFSSVTRRMFDTAGVDEEIEFFGFGQPPRADDTSVWLHSFELPADPADLVRRLLLDRRFQAIWRDLHRDVELGAEVVRNGLRAAGIVKGTVEILLPTFYRGKSAYVVSRVVAGSRVMPLVAAIHHNRRGLHVGAILVDSDDVSVLFSYAHSEFVVRAPNPSGIVEFIRSLIPHRRPAELYTAIGFRKHGKTELYRDVADHVARTRDRFMHAPGIPGLVMIVFSLDDFDMVFKVIRDHFPPQKKVTPLEVRAKYSIVSRHDRAGRLIDAQEFRGLTFPKERFNPGLLEELTASAAKSVSVVGETVFFERVYVERRVTPLDLFLRNSDTAEAEGAIVDYGTAIKNMAASNIFPGDMLIKNFGVTRQGRVVFYDYDELSLLTECKFRRIPVSTHPDDEMSATPWFGVGDDDIFPEEFRNFLGVAPELRSVFEEHHSDLFGINFWMGLQERISDGEMIEVFPYRRQVALHQPGSV